MMRTVLLKHTVADHFSLVKSSGLVLRLANAGRVPPRSFALTELVLRNSGRQRQFKFRRVARHRASQDGVVDAEDPLVLPDGPSMVSDTEQSDPRRKCTSSPRNWCVREEQLVLDIIGRTMP
jgi:hypothetical protein